MMCMELKRISINEIDSHITAETIFVGCSSFENRCLSIARAIAPDKIETALVAYYEDILPYIKESNNDLVPVFGNKAKNVALNTIDPIRTADNLWRALDENVNDGDDVLVDITTFTHESLLILLKLLALVTRGNCNIQFVYTSAETYGGVVKESSGSQGTDQDDTFESLWLSKGIIEIRNVLGFSGELLPSRKTHLIILVGFEYDRALELVSEYEPGYLSLGFGKASGSISDKHHRANRKFHSLLKEITSTWQPVADFEFSCNNPLETQHAIMAQASIYPDTNIIVAPMNTKISTLGTYLANQENEAIQVCYARPLKYNYQNYSTPGDTCYVFELPGLCKN